MSKQIKISEYMFKQLWLEKKHREIEMKMTLSYSEVIGLLMNLTIKHIKEAHKINRYKIFDKEKKE